MSGTSLDAIDIALCSSGDSFKLEDSLSYPLDRNLKRDILNIIEDKTTIKEIGEIDYRLAIEFSRGVKELLKRTKLKPNNIKAIGSHGQTIWHEPRGEYPFTMQLANPSVLAVESGIDVVSDFRSKDVALGGEGAPFAPAFHKELFSNIKNCAVVNIGGMSNITIFSPELIGYDCGCGNVLMDLWIREVKNLEFDRDGEFARSGKVHSKLLEAMLNDRYFKLNYPKSTGREYFNKDFLIKYLEPFDKISDCDIQATLLALTVHSIANEVDKFDIDNLLICGGGAKNRYLMKQLQERLPNIDIKTTNSYGVDLDYIEAMIFAWLAKKRLNRERVNLKTVTGAKKNTILGGVYASD
jgi:anhydro-N-acetylmuramic acid kinase